MVDCRHCSRRTEVPAALAQLPQPQLAGVVASTPVDEASLADGSPDEQGPDGEPAAMRRIGRSMPWVISGIVHAALGLILLLVVCFAIDPTEADMTPAMAPLPPDNPPIEMPEPDPTKDVAERSERLGDLSLDIDHSRRFNGPSDEPWPEDIAFALTGREEPAGENGLGLGDGHGDIECRIGPFNPGGADNIVFVIDRSGSMHRTFGLVRVEMQRSIMAMHACRPAPWDECKLPNQAFHVIFFAEGDPQEQGARRLVPASEDNKVSACAFIQEARAKGQTNPVPALRRAFAALDRAEDGGKGKVMFLLTDGDFPDNQEVLETITELNRGVVINTILYGRRTAEAETVMQQIADASGGVYKFISLDEIQGDID